MRILVTGAGGFIGRRIVGHLVSLGHTVHAHHRRPGPDAAGATPGLFVHGGDLADGLRLPEALDLVIHAAAAGQKGLTTEACLCGNLDTTRAVLAAVRAGGVGKVIFLSSMATIGHGDGPVVDENSGSVNPQPYGMIKRLCELLFQESAPDLQTLTLRLPNVLGYGCRNHFISEVFDRLRHHRPLTAFNPDGRFNSVIHIDALCRFIGAAIERGWDRPELLCLGAAEPPTVAATIEQLARGCASRSPINWETSHRQPYLISSRRAEERFGYRPEPVEAAIGRYVREELAGPAGIVA